MSCVHLRSMTCLACRRKGLGWDDDHDARLRGALLALARVGVFVSMEAWARANDGPMDGVGRALAIAWALQHGRLRLDWRSEG